jgi:hypothetical protein
MLRRPAGQDTRRALAGPVGDHTGPAGDHTGPAGDRTGPGERPRRTGREWGGVGNRRGRHDRLFASSTLLHLY